MYHSTERAWGLDRLARLTLEQLPRSFCQYLDICRAYGSHLCARPKAQRAHNYLQLAFNKQRWYEQAKETVITREHGPQA